MCNDNKENSLLEEWLLKVFDEKEFISNLRNVSCDSSNTAGFIYMIDREDIIVFDYDKIKEKCNRNLRSNDALFVMKDKGKIGDLIWVEFKNGNLLDRNGKLNYHINQELIEKIYDSVNIFLKYLYENSIYETENIREDPIKYLRDHSRYYLVYNAEKNVERSKFINHFAKLADESLIGLSGFQHIKNKFSGYLHRELYAYTPEDFENMLDDYLCSKI